MMMMMMLMTIISPSGGHFGSSNSSDAEDQTRAATKLGFSFIDVKSFSARPVHLAHFFLLVFR